LKIWISRTIQQEIIVAKWNQGFEITDEDVKTILDAYGIKQDAKAILESLTGENFQQIVVWGADVDEMTTNLLSGLEDVLQTRGIIPTGDSKFLSVEDQEADD
jgi:hypothetical protein